MAELTLVYFDGCPNAVKARQSLSAAGLEFKEIRQDELPATDPLKSLSSPSILAGDKLLFGTRTGAQGGCSLEIPTADDLKALAAKEGANGRASILAPTGSFGSIVTVLLCPVCKPAIAVFLSSIGLGFMVQNSVMQGILIVFLALMVLGLFYSYRKVHGKLGPVLVGLVMAVALYLGRYMYFGMDVNAALTYGGIVGLVGVSVWNMLLKRARSCGSDCQSGGCENA